MNFEVLKGEFLSISWGITERYRDRREGFIIISDCFGKVDHIWSNLIPLASRTFISPYYFLRNKLSLEKDANTN